MNGRSLLIASAIATAAGLSCVCPAAAQEFAAGVNCSGLTCENATDESFVVSGVANCLPNPATTPSLPGQPPVPQAPYQNAFSAVVGPHSTVTLTPACRGGDSLTGWNLTGAAPGTGMPSGSAG
ncbi:hypothetical protein [Nocardia sp. IFM 10818]